MTTVRVSKSKQFTSWTCPCGTAFEYPDGRYPSLLVNRHFDEDCPNPIEGQMAGAGSYGRTLTYMRLPTQNP